MELLEALDAKHACNVGTAEAYTDQYVRVENYGWTGEYVSGYGMQFPHDPLRGSRMILQHTRMPVIFFSALALDGPMICLPATT